jgi:energy-coupling factor transport system permease protein
MILLKVLRLAESMLSYQPSDRFLHRLNPLTKLAFLFGVIIAGVFLSGEDVPWWVSGGVFAALALLCATGGVNLRRELSERWAYVVAIIGVLMIGNLVFAPTIKSSDVTVYFDLPPFIYITNLTLNFALAKSMFLLCSITAVIMVLKSTRLADLTHALTKVGVPYAIAQMAATSLRCIPMVVDGLVIVYNAQRARGLELEGGSAKSRIAAWKTMLSPLFVVLLKWIDLMSLVFQARGLDFSFGKKRTRLRKVPFRAIDALALVVGLGSLALLVYAAQVDWLHV